MGKIRKAVRRRPESLEKIRSPLESLFQEYGPDYLQSDPLKFAHRYPSRRNREVVAFLSAILAFGNVKAIFNSMERLLSLLGNDPHETLVSWPSKMPAGLSSFKHRWVTANDIHILFLALKELLSEYGSLEGL